MRQLIAFLACFLLCLPAFADGFSGGGSPTPTGTANQVVVTGTSPPVLSLPNTVIIPGTTFTGSATVPTISLQGSTDNIIYLGTTQPSSNNAINIGDVGSATINVIAIAGTLGAQLGLQDGAGKISYFNAANTFSTALTALTPTANNSITMPNASGTIVLSGANSNLTSLSGLRGTLVFTGSGSGTCTVGVPAAAGTGTVFNFPATNGSSTNVLQTDGAGNTSWAATSSGGPSVSFNSNAPVTTGNASLAIPQQPLVPTSSGILQPLPPSNSYTAGAETVYSTTGSSVPYGICAGPDGRIWVAYLSTSKVAAFTTAGTETVYSTTGSSTPQGICAGPDGRIWVAYAGTNKVAAFTTAGTETVYSTTGSSNPYGICAGPDGRIWVAYSGTNKIGTRDLNLTAGTRSSVTPITTINGSGSGHFYWSMPEQGPSYKVFVLNAAGVTDAGGGTITYPTAFTYTPSIMWGTGTTTFGPACSTTTSTFTLGASTAVTGSVTVEGF